MKLTRSMRVVLWSTFWLLFIVVGAELIVAEGLLWRNYTWEPYILTMELDDWTHNAFVIKDLLKDKDTAYHHVIFLGGSAGREAVFDDLTMSKKISQSVGKKIKFTSICSSNQTFADEAKIIEALKPLDATFVIPVESLRFSRGARDQLVIYHDHGFHHPKYYYMTADSRINDILQDAGIEIGLLHRSRLLRTTQVLGRYIHRRLERVARGENLAIHFTRHRYIGDPPPDKKYCLEIEERINASAKEYYENFELNFELLSTAIDLARGNGNEVVLLDFPTNPDFHYHLTEIEPHYDSVLNVLLEEKNIRYIDSRPLAEWQFEDYRDFRHMRDSGREKFEGILLTMLTDFVDDIKTNKEMARK